jgi:hypothetical protein
MLETGTTFTRPRGDFMGAAVAIILRKERDIVSTYRGAGAVSPGRARQPEELGLDRRLVFDRLVRRAVLREANDGRYYLDEPSWEALRSTRRRAVMIFAIVALVVVAALVASGAVNFGATRAG